MVETCNRSLLNKIEGALRGLNKYMSPVLDINKYEEPERSLAVEIRAVEARWKSVRNPDAVPFSILIKPSYCLEGSSRPIASVMIFKDGATIWYARSITPQLSKLAIAHELGHIELKHVNPNGLCGSAGIVDPNLEMQANLFAERLLRQQSARVNSGLSRFEIRASILEVQPEYESLLNNY